jgi:hypothetical protein
MKSLATRFSILACSESKELMSLRFSLPFSSPSGFESAGMVNDITKTSVLVSRNEISNTSCLGILIMRHNQPFSSNLILDKNVLTDTGDGSFPGLKHCIENSLCSRNVTGKRHELQLLFVCLQCDFTTDTDKVLCYVWARTCHKGHKGVLLEAEAVEVSFGQSKFGFLIRIFCSKRCFVTALR